MPLAQTPKGNPRLALSCYPVLGKSLDYRNEAPGGGHTPTDWQGRGPGNESSSPRGATSIERCVTRVLLLAGAIDAEAKPATATNRAKMRIAVFIFGNLLGLTSGEIDLPTAENRTPLQRTKPYVSILY
jgi:hypothetical protein